MDESRCCSNCTCSQLKKAKDTIAQLTMILNNAAVKLSEVSECVKQLKCETCRSKSLGTCTGGSGTASASAVEELDTFASALEKIDSIASPVEVLDSIASTVEEVDSMASSVEVDSIAGTVGEFDSMVTAEKEIVSSLVEEAHQRSVTSDGKDAQSAFVSFDIRTRTKDVVEDSFAKAWSKRILEESKEEEKELAKKCLKNLTDVVFEVEERYVSRVVIALDVDKIYERPAVDDLVKLSQEDWNLSGKVEACRGFKTVYVTVLAGAFSKPPAAPGGSYCLDFIINRFMYNKMRAAVEKISTAEQSNIINLLRGEEMLTRRSRLGGIKVFEQAWLNKSQKDALITAIENPVSLIFGPYGCGKTSVIVSIVQNLKDEGKVLAVAPSNLASDHLTESLAGKGLKVLRVVGKARQKINSAVDEHCLHIKVRDMIGDLGELVPSEIAKMEREAREQIIDAAEVIITTCASASCEAVKSISKFSAIIVDEACQVCPPKIFFKLSPSPDPIMFD